MRCVKTCTAWRRAPPNRHDTFTCDITSTSTSTSTIRRRTYLLMLAHHSAPGVQAPPAGIEDSRNLESFSGPSSPARHAHDGVVPTQVPAPSRPRNTSAESPEKPSCRREITEPWPVGPIEEGRGGHTGYTLDGLEDRDGLMPISAGWFEGGPAAPFLGLRELFYQPAWTRTWM